jgi:hypothetical protein
MNAPTSIVDRLEPLRTPETIGWWPPAPGWWVLALLALLLLAFLARQLWRYYRRGAPLRVARQSLERLAESDADLPARLEALAKLQRRVAIRIAGRRACAGLTGQAWVDFLNDLGPEGQAPFDAHLAELPYRPEIRAADWDDSLAATRAWLDGLGRPA